MYTNELEVFQPILVKIEKLYRKFTNYLEASNPEYFKNLKLSIPFHVVHLLFKNQIYTVLKSILGIES